MDNGAVFGFTTSLKKLIDSENPEYIAVAFDSPGPTFRKEIDPNYKANRDAPPEDLNAQVPFIKEIIKAYGIPMIQQSGYEADDIIGTLATKAASDDLQIVIVSADKDLLQLVRGQDVVMFDASKGVHYMGEDKIQDFFGCEPHQIIDLLTIWGDSSDNVPGVPGVGEKGAKTLLAKYGSLENIYTHLEEITRKSYREGFEAVRDKIPDIRTLVTIKTDLDIPFDLEEMKLGKPNQNALMNLFTKLRFQSLLEEDTRDLATSTGDFQAITDLQTLQAWVKKVKKSGSFVFDIETTSLDVIVAELVGIAMAVSEDDAVYVPLAHDGQDPKWSAQAIPLLKQLMADPALTKVAHNAKYDFSVLTQLGWEFEGVIDDTMAMSYLINPTGTKHGLDDVAEMRLGYKTISFEEVCGSGTEQTSFAQAPIDKATQYAAEDADICLKIKQILEPEIEELGLARVYTELERPLIPVLSKMELRGIRVDRAFLAEMSKKLARQTMTLQIEIFDLAGEKFNIKSTKQLGRIMFEKLGLPVMGKTTKTKSYSTSEQTLEKLAALGHELPVKLLEYRTLTKLTGTYVDKLPEMINPISGRVHSAFNQFVTATGRLSSNDPNLQNIPIRTEVGREIRAAFTTEPGWMLLAADYSQIELRLLAHFSEDPTLLDGFTKGEDIHRRTASEVMGLPQSEITDDLRRAAKSINFGLIYGMGEFRLAQELGISRKEARDYIETYFSKMPRVPEFTERVIAEARAAGEVRTLFGRRRALPEINSRNKNLQRQGERLAVNTLIQGSAAEVIKLAMIRFDRMASDKKLQAHLILQVHDELVIECPEDQLDETRRSLRIAMEGAGEFRVPLTVELGVGKNWKEAKT